MASKKRAGKPRDIKLTALEFMAIGKPHPSGPYAWVGLGDEYCSHIENAKEARRLAAWLLKFADWAEEAKRVEG